LIIAAGLTPAWQQILRFDGFHVGEVNRALDVHWCSSGKVLNVAIALAHLGAECETVALVGGPPRAHIEAEFSPLGARRRWVAAEAPTRICTTILDSRTGVATELVENAGPVTTGELEQFMAAYTPAAASAQWAILTGSLPQGAPQSYFRDLLAKHPDRVIEKAVFDQVDEAVAFAEASPMPGPEELFTDVYKD
jgi:fructose-1-phosphate kinase PfkB-like protein